MSCSCLMATPSCLSAEEAQYTWDRFSDDVSGDYVKEKAIADQVRKGIQYLQEKGAAFEVKAFERDEDCDVCKIAGTLDDDRVSKMLERKNPSLILCNIDLSEVTKGTQLFLFDADVLGYVTAMDEQAEVCTLQVTAVGLDEGGAETSLNELIQTRSLDDIKRMWILLDQHDKIKHLTRLLKKETPWQLFKSATVPHDYACDTEDIVNLDLLALLYDDKAVYESLCSERRVDFPLKFVPHVPGCGKIHYMLQYIQQKEASRFVFVAHSDVIEFELATRMLEEGENFTQRKIYFLGEYTAALPPAWKAMIAANMDVSMLEKIAEEDGIIVIGTVKKIDDLRRRCRDNLFKLRFQEILHDEFVRQTKLDFYTISKVAATTCYYQVFGDRMQTKATVNAETCVESMENFRAGQEIQRDMWKSYDDYIKSKEPPSLKIER